jgi:hypothetical protein
MRMHALCLAGTLLVSCGPEKKTERFDPVGAGGGGGGNSGDQTEVTGPCADDTATVTGIVGTRNIGFTADIVKADYEAPVDSKPGTLTIELDGNGKIWLQFMNSPVQGSAVAARGVVIRESDDLAVGHCSDSVFSAQLALAEDVSSQGSFYLTGFYGHDGEACDKEPVAGTLAGCFYY